MADHPEPSGAAGIRERIEALTLYLVVFICGAVLMGAEIAGSRVLHPFFGSAIFVWGSLIGVIIVALAVGNYLGGVCADRMPSFGLLCGIVAGAGFFLLILPTFAVTLCGTIERAFPGPRVGPLLASMLLFLAPGMLLATVPPFAIRLSARDLVTVGNVAGRLGALSNAGSIVGTLLTAFALIPLMGTMKLIFSLGVILILAAAVGYLVVWRLKKGSPIPAGALVLACGLVSLGAYPQGPGAEITQWYDYRMPHELKYWTDSAYHLILVTEQPGYKDYRTGRIRPRRLLRFNDRVQSAIFIDDEVYDRTTGTLKEYESAVGYTDLLHLGLIFCPEATRALFIGGGGGIGPTEFTQHYGIKCEIIEIDPEVERVARKHFFVDSRVTYHIGDGRRVLSRLEGGYDLIVLDAYSSGGHIPAHLTTKEFLELCRSKLSPRGVVVSNVISVLKDEGSDFYQSEYRTMYEAGFANVYTFPRYPSPEEERARGLSREDFWRVRSINIIIVATQNGKRVTKSHIASTARLLTERETHPVKIDNFVHYAKGLWEGSRTKQEMFEEMTRAVVLTDEYCPVDTMFHD